MAPAVSSSESRQLMSNQHLKACVQIRPQQLELATSVADKLNRDFGYGTVRRLLAKFDRSASQQQQVYEYSKRLL